MLIQCLWRCYAADKSFNSTATWQIYLKDTHMSSGNQQNSSTNTGGSGNYNLPLSKVSVMLRLIWMRDCCMSLCAGAVVFKERVCISSFLSSICKDVELKAKKRGINIINGSLYRIWLGIQALDLKNYSIPERMLVRREVEENCISLFCKKTSTSIALISRHL